MPLFESDTNLNQDYRVERFLGEGAFAEVYRVQHRFLGRQAMKVFKTPSDDDAEVQRVLSEAILLSRIGHPNIIRVFNAGVLAHQGVTRGFFTMELVPGGTLDRHWRSFGRTLMPLHEAVDIITQVTAGVAVAHSETPPIVHRDIKPQNILVGYDAAGIRARIGDFGLAKEVNPMTLLLSSRGTMAFKPPEALENLDSTAGDVWAIGCVLQLLLTDEPPFPEPAKKGELVKPHHLASYRPPSVFNLAVDEFLDRILEKCLQLDPAARYPDASALLKDLQQWSNHTSRIKPQVTMHEGGNPASPSERPDENGTQGEPVWQTPLAQAMELAKSPSSLTQAADMLEELMSRFPVLRDRHEATIRLWRRGISM